ncbi:hypothetical protein V6N13_140259 [Hibiscus sabdariffa]
MEEIEVFRMNLRNTSGHLTCYSNSRAISIVSNKPVDHNVRDPQLASHQNSETINHAVRKYLQTNVSSRLNLGYRQKDIEKISMLIEVEDGILKCIGIENDTISHRTKFGNSDTVRPNDLPRDSLFAM